MILPVLTIAASDSSGAAGAQADLKTYEARGVYGMSAITALTAQNSLSIRGVKLSEPEFVAAQIRAVLDDAPIAAIKTGLLFNAGIIHSVVESLLNPHADSRTESSTESIKPLVTPNLIVDPVLVAGDGRRLVDDAALEAYRVRLFPLATLITPNLLEAELLIGEKIRTVEEMKDAARYLHTLYSPSGTNVLLKGGHLSGNGDGLAHEESTTPSSEAEVLDILIVNGAIYEIRGELLPLKNPRGIGCTFASCIAAELAKGYPLPQAVATGREYITAALRGALEWKLGSGRGTIFHAVPTYGRDQVAASPIPVMGTA